MLWKQSTFYLAILSFVLLSPTIDSSQHHVSSAQALTEDHRSSSHRSSLIRIKTTQQQQLGQFKYDKEDIDHLDQQQIVLNDTEDEESTPYSQDEDDQLVVKAQQSSATNNKFAVVVDCGSSGTRATIYFWPANISSFGADSEILLKLEALRKSQPGGELLTLKIRPGLASVRDQPDAASDYMRPIMRFASDNVPSAMHRETPVYFLATAGLRLLTDQEQQDILEDIARDLKVEFDFGPITTRVISGAQEGAYRWLAVNWAASRLSNHFDQSQASGLFGFLRQLPRDRRYAIIEMGGASAQVTFELSAPLVDSVIGPRLAASSLEAKQAFDESQLRLNTRLSSSSSLNRPPLINLFSVTFLNFGSDSARNLAVDLLVRDAIRMPARSNYGTFLPLIYSANSSIVLEDPCLPVGSSESAVKPAALLYDQSKTIGFTAKPGERETLTVHLIGRGSFMHCKFLLERVIQISKQEQTVCESQKSSTQQNCASASLLGSQFLPWRHLQFLGLSELFYTTNEILQAAGRFNGPKIQLNSLRVCSLTYETLKRQFPQADQFDSRRTLLECFKSTWILVWLQSGLLMPMKHLADFKTIDKLEGHELDWTLGALIEQLAAE